MNSLKCNGNVIAVIQQASWIASSYERIESSWWDPSGEGQVIRSQQNYNHLTTRTHLNVNNRLKIKDPIYKSSKFMHLRI